MVAGATKRGPPAFPSLFPRRSPASAALGPSAPRVVWTHCIVSSSARRWRAVQPSHTDRGRLSEQLPTNLLLLVRSSRALPAPRCSSRCTLRGICFSCFGVVWAGRSSPPKGALGLVPSSGRLTALERSLAAGLARLEARRGANARCRARPARARALLVVGSLARTHGCVGSPMGSPMRHARP